MKCFISNNNYYVQPRGSFAQTAVWRPVTALDLASQWPGTRDEPPSMRGECAICGRGAEFPRASAQCLPDFSSSLFIALAGFTSQSFLSPAQCKGLSSRLNHRACRAIPHRFMVYPIFPIVQGQSLDFVELCNIFVYCRAKYFRVRPLTSCRRFPHTSGLPLDSCLLPHIHARWRKKYFSHFIEL